MEKVEVSNGAREIFTDNRSHEAVRNLISNDCNMANPSDMSREAGEHTQELADSSNRCVVEQSGDTGGGHSSDSSNVVKSSLQITPPEDNDDSPSVQEDSRNQIDQSGPTDEISRALLQRKQPLMELVSSEEGYVRRLRMVKERYMPIVTTARTPATPLPCETSLLSSAVFSSNTTNVGTSPSSQPPTVPDDLAARWRIVWGNWIQLYEWHSTFLEKLTSLIEVDPDRIPKLFIDSRARLRSIYSKYCENHRKAALIAEQYRDYFEDLRVYLGDKEDVVSYLMQPVQRIMRYQLPMTEIVKYTQRACSPDLHLWKKALDIMKEIPKDTQLILEAARIDGFPGVITALGNILIRGDLLVATSTRDQLLETVTAYKLALQESTNSMGLPDSVHAVVRSSFTTASSQPNRSATTPTSPTSVSTPTPTPSAHFPSTNTNNNNQVNTTATAIAAATTTSPTMGSSVSAGTGSSVVSDTTGPSVTADSGGELFVGNLKFTESRLFLFEQMLVVTEEARPKRRTASSDTFAQSTYQFRAAINVNKMRYESHWYNCSLPNGHTNADAAAVDQFLSTGLAPDDLRFAVLDQTPGRDVVYVIDPITSSNRQAWVVQLRDIQRMQHEFLLALQDPRRFKTGARDETWSAGDSPSSDSPHFLTRPDPPAPIVALENSQLGVQPPTARQRKWPSFTMNRPRRLGSSSSSSTAVATSAPTANIGKPIPTSASLASAHPSSSLAQDPLCTDRPTNLLARSLSAERRPLLRTSNSARSSSKPLGPGSGPDAEEDPDAPYFRKSSLSANSSLKVTNQIGFMDGAGNLSPDANNTGNSKTGAGKKRNVFANLFGRNKSKHRTHKHLAQHTPPASALPQYPSSSSRFSSSTSTEPTVIGVVGAAGAEMPPRPASASASHSLRTSSGSAIRSGSDEFPDNTS